MELYFIAYSGLINSLTSFLLGFLALFKNYNSRTNRSFAYFAFAVGSWAIFYFFWLLAKRQEPALIFIRCAMVGAILIPLTYTYFTDRLLEKRSYALHLLNLILAGIFICFSFSSIYISKVESRLFFSYWPVPGYLFHAMLLYFVSNVIYAQISLLYAIQNLRGIRRMQVKYVFYGTLIGFIGGCTNYFLWYNIPVPPYLNLLVSVYVICVAYAIVRYRLMDVRVLLSRATIFGIVYMFVLGISFGLGYIIFGRWGVWAIAVLTAIVLASLGPFLYLFLQRKAEDRILRQQRKIQETLIRVFNHITRVRKLDKLVRLIAKLLTRVLKVEHSVVFLLDSKTLQYRVAGLKGKLPYFPETILPPDSLLIKYIQKHREPIVYEELKPKSDEQNSKKIKEVVSLMHNISAQVIVPSFIEDTLLGFAILGNKISGEIYTQQDLFTLSLISERFTVAIEYAQFLKEYEEFQSKLREAEKLKGIAQMMYSLNHELRNIFNKASMPIQLITMGEFEGDKEKTDNALKSVYESIELGTEILSYVQSYSSKSKSNGIKSKNIYEAIDKTVAYFDKRFKDAGIILTKQIQPNLPVIQAKDVFDDLFKDILANCYFALTDQPREQKLIDIQIKLSDGSNDIQIKISDTGPDMTKITSYTYEMDSPFKERGKVGGVNLFLAHIITNDLNGRLTFKSYEKGGTTFLLNIPVVQEV